MTDIETDLWNSLNDAEMNALYYGYLSRRYALFDKAIVIFTSIMSAAAVASLQFWKTKTGNIEWNHLWDALTLISVILSAAAPFLTFSDTSRKAGSLRPLFLQYQIKYNDLWLKRNSLNNQSLLKKLSEIKTGEVQDTTIDSTMKRDKKLLLKCQNEIMIKKGLIP